MRCSRTSIERATDRVAGFSYALMLRPVKLGGRLADVGGRDGRFMEGRWGITNFAPWIFAQLRGSGCSPAPIPNTRRTLDRTILAFHIALGIMSATHTIDTNGSWNYTRRTANATDEMEVLAVMGREGWELVDFGVLYLEFRQPVDPQKAMTWEYDRYTGLGHDDARRERLAQGWEPSGRWGPFLYFKRSILA